MESENKELKQTCETLKAAMIRLESDVMATEIQNPLTSKKRIQSNSLDPKSDRLSIRLRTGKKGLLNPFIKVENKLNVSLFLLRK